MPSHSVQNSLPVIALVGRPNVGKSSLFNRLLKRRQAVVSEVAGTTRDRLKEVITLGGQEVLLVDMAGIEPALTQKDEISAGMQHQVEQALSEATVVVWVVDCLEGATAQDEKVAELLRRLKKPVIVAVNKCDHDNHATMQYEFMRFGFEPLIPLSAMHNRGMQPLYEALKEMLSIAPTPTVVEESPVPDVDDRELRLAIIGRPNVGKSTLLNALAGESRAVVSPISGTTRDAVDTVLPAEKVFDRTFTKFLTVRIVDTAGIRQPKKMGHTVEAWSVLRSIDALDQAQIALLVIDATEGITHQDLVVADKVMDTGRPLIIIANKWDAVLASKNLIPGTPEAEELQEKFQQRVLNKAPFLSWVQLLFVSAETKHNLHYLGRVILRAYQAWSMEPKEEELAELGKVLSAHPRLKNLIKITYSHAQPPVFVLHTEGKVLPHFTTRRMVENYLRDFFEIGPTPIKIWVERSMTPKEKSQRY